MHVVASREVNDEIVQLQDDSTQLRVRQPILHGARGAEAKQRLTPQAAEIETGFSKSTVSASQHCCATRILCLCHHPFGSFLY